MNADPSIVDKLRARAREFVASFRPTHQIYVLPPRSDVDNNSRIEDYLRKSIVLRQIMSNQSRRFSRINAAQSITTVVVSSALLFLGFSGLDKMAIWISWVYPVSKDVVELGFNGLVFDLFVVATLHLVFQFPTKQAKAEQSVAALAALSNEIEDEMQLSKSIVINDLSDKIPLIRAKYEAIALTIPANSDREFIKAKKDLISK